MANSAKIFFHPKASISLASCSQNHPLDCGDSTSSCKEVTDPNNTCDGSGIDSRHDIAIITLLDPLPESITPIPVLLAPEHQNGRFSSAIPASDLETFITQQTPRAAIAGHGRGSTKDEALSAALSQTIRTRDLGITTLFDTRLDMDARGIQPWAGCTTRASVTSGVLLSAHPTDIGLAELATHSLPGGLLANGDKLALDTGGGANRQSWLAGGDSGGPLLIGGNLQARGLTTTPLKQSWIDEGLVPADQHFVVGVASRGEPAKLANGQFNPQPLALFAATYEAENSAFIARFIADEDDDGIPDGVDPCVGDTDNTDYDGDGLVGKCDPCPCSPSGGAAPGSDDADGDKVCDVCDPSLVPAGDPGNNYCQSYCASHPPDSCPNTPKGTKPRNYNGNERAEQAQQGTRMADECDPVPYPDFDVETGSEQVVNQSSTGYGTPSSNPGILYTAERILINNQLAIKPVGSHFSPKVAGATANVGPREVPVGVAATSLRVCIGGIQGIDCKDPSQQTTNDSLLNQAETLEDENESTIWHRILTNGATSAGSTLNNILYNQTNPSQPTTSIERFWDWQADYQRWFFSWGPVAHLKTPSQPDGGQVTFWLNGNSGVGMSNGGLAITGYHPRTTDPSQAATKLSNHYSSAKLREVISVRRFQPFGGRSYKPRPFVFQPCYTCPPADRLGYDPGYPQRGPLDFGSPYNGRSAQIYVQVEGHPELHGLLTEDGSMRDVSDRLGEQFKARLTEDHVWASQAEASASLGRGQTLPAIIALSPDGLSITEQVSLGTGKVYGQGDLGFSAAPTSASKVAKKTPKSPPASQDFVPVYSRSTGKIFVVGGNLPGTNTPRRDIRWAFVDSGTFARLDTTFQPEQVVSATYSTRDGRLWVLDRRKAGHKTMVRLTRIDPMTGVAETVGEWKHKGMYDQHWLVADQDGSILVVGSSEQPRKHTVVKLNNDTDIEIGGIRRASGELAMSPVVDEEGYWFVVQKKKQDFPRLVRLTSLQKNGPKCDPDDSWEDKGKSKGKDKLEQLEQLW